ncbi:hypothetical protein DFH07DRAFT_770952 [Mycena maculata]|uniref:Uncharacterized protein n=1 Tax=Mycena maculata TaxID=230809 RepID=A0AAD7JEY7_9AGAR|nr:hypothetical protein DFH07DRAFT_770952 [Mycena maculata]
MTVPHLKAAMCGIASTIRNTNRLPTVVIFSTPNGETAASARAKQHNEHSTQGVNVLSSYLPPTHRPEAFSERSQNYPIRPSYPELDQEPERYEFVTFLIEGSTEILGIQGPRGLDVAPMVLAASGS